MEYKKIPILNESNFMKWLEDPSFGECEVTITPKLVEKIRVKVREYEEKTGEPANRQLYLERSESYASPMKGGNWNEKIGDPIRFFNDAGFVGILGDGQTRLDAQVLSGQTIKYPARKGLVRRDILDIDGHKPRNVADGISIVLRLNYAAQRASICKHIATMITGKIKRSEIHGIEKIIDIFKNEIDLVLKNSTSGLKRALRIAPIQTAFVISAKIAPKETEEFMKGYFTGNNLFDEGLRSPIKKLRDHILETGRPNYTGPQRRQNSLFAFNMLKAYILSTPIRQKRKDFLTSNEGLDFFISKIPKIKEQIKDLFRY
jgi:hypothetical protein